MKRVISSGIRTALITGLIVLVLTPVAALASRVDCPGSVSAPASAAQGSPITVGGTGLQWDSTYSIRL